MAGKRKVTETTYIRQLPYSVVKYISTIVDIDGNWEKLVCRIPKRLADLEKPECDKRYSQLQIRVFGSKLNRPDGSPTKTILEDWGTQNATVTHLIRIFQETSLYDAADYISVNVLHGEKVTRLQVNQEVENNTIELPRPQWNKADKPKTVKSADMNFDNFSDEKIYVRDKLVGGAEGVQQNGTYSSLQKENSEEGTYNKLSPKSVDVIYNRIPSFTSGGLPSLPLRNDNKAEVKDGEENEDETFQIRKLKELSSEKGQELLTEKGQEHKNEDMRPIQQERVPCETIDDTPTDGSSSVVDDIYSMICSQKIDFNMLKHITDQFNRNPLCQGGRVIGSGGFGEVFLGEFDNGYKVAVKLLKDVDEVEKQFTTELESLLKYRHKNIVRLFGYSIDKAGKCLVYEYLCNGSLEDRLQRKDDTPPLPTTVRVSILKGTAEGIFYLNEQGIVHRDIKSANVLLDVDFQPKVGDFATVRAGPKGGNTLNMCSIVIGTSAYLAPEAINFDVSTKLDSYSFGVVILEVLTSLPPLDKSREEMDIISHVEENNLPKLLDMSGGEWSEKASSMLLSISEKCTRKKKQRANISDILSELMSVPPF